MVVVGGEGFGWRSMVEVFFFLLVPPKPKKLDKKNYDLEKVARYRYLEV